MKRGFSLLEVVIALAISSMLGVLLFNMFNQSTRALKVIDSIVSSDMNVMGFYDRFEKDISGAFIPLVGDPERASKLLMQQEEKIRTRDLERQEEQPDKNNKKLSSSVKMVTIGDIQLKNPFLYESGPGGLKRFSCITCNPMQVYKQIKPCLARVIYQLEPDKKRAQRYILTRKESQKLPLAADKKTRSFVLLNNIVSLKLTFLAMPPQKKEKEKEKNKVPQKQEEKSDVPEEKSQALQQYDIWPRGKDDKREGTVEDLPQFVRVDLRYGDPYEERIRTYEFIIPIFAYRAPSEDVLRSPLITQERVKKDEIEKPQSQQGKRQK